MKREVTDNIWIPTRKLIPPREGLERPRLWCMMITRCLRKSRLRRVIKERYRSAKESLSYVFYWQSLITSFLQGSTLDPSAPEFTPRSRPAAATTAYSPTSKPTMAGHDPFSQTLTPVHMQQPGVVPPIVSLPRPVEPPNAQSFAESSTKHAQHSIDTAARPVSKIKAVQDNQKRKVSYKIPRYTRRGQARSEPSDSRTTTS